MKVNLNELKKIVLCCLDSKLFTTVKICQKQGKLILERYDGIVNLRADLSVEGDFGIDSVVELDWLEFVKVCGLSYDSVDIRYRDKKVCFDFGGDFLVELPEVNTCDSLKKVDLGDVIKEIVLTSDIVKMIDISKGIVDESMVVPAEFYNVKLIEKDKKIDLCCSNVVSVYMSKKDIVSDFVLDINSKVLEVIKNMLSIGTVKLFLMNIDVTYCEVRGNNLEVKIFFALPTKKLPDIISFVGKEYSKELGGRAIIKGDSLKKSLLEICSLMSPLFSRLKFEFKKDVLEMHYTDGVNIRRKVKDVKIEKEFSSILDVKLFKDFINRSNSDIVMTLFKNSNIVFIESDVGLIGVAQSLKT